MFSKVQYQVGAPVPWYEFEFAAGKRHGFENDYEHRFQSRFNFLSPAWLVMATAFAALHLHHRLQLRRGETSAGWSQPRIHAIVWLIFAALAMSLGHLTMTTHFARGS